MVTLYTNLGEAAVEHGINETEVIQPQLHRTKPVLVIEGLNYFFLQFIGLQTETNLKLNFVLTM